MFFCFCFVRSSHSRKARHRGILFWYSLSGFTWGVWGYVYVVGGEGVVGVEGVVGICVCGGRGGCIWMLLKYARTVRICVQLTILIIHSL